MRDFFDSFPSFLATSKTGASAVRLNARYRAIIESNSEVIRGRKILDIASHDGRWSFAALHAGCSHVRGVEARPHLVQNAHTTFSALDVAKERFDFVTGDVFEVMKRGTIKAETVLLLGFFYHTDRHSELADLLAATGASHIILDTNIVPAAENLRKLPLIKLFQEPTGVEANAIGPDAMAVVGHPSREAIDLINSRHGFSMSEFDWAPSRGPRELQDYNEDRRSTFVLSR